MSAVLVGLGVLVVAATTRWLLRAARDRRRAERTERRAVEVLRALAGELPAGATTLQAVRSVASEAGSGTDTDIATDGGADGDALAAELTAAASAPDEARLATSLRGAPTPLVPLSAAVSVSAATGAPLADLLGRLASVSARAADDAREVQAVLAGPRTTAALLAGLPALGLLLSASTGGSPVAFLLGSPGGRVCLFAGVILDAAGLCWIERFARRVRR